MQDLMRRFSEAVATLYAAGERPRHWDDALRAACRYSGAETLRVEVVSRVPGAKFPPPAVTSIGRGPIRRTLSSRLRRVSRPQGLK